ncbi:MAG: hypothetical protein BMS9Abin26_0079 [Gammaproteobacteria bacterium]|nr:MAG: hypothetical protein BMS9Abin26_0079 [Gammaproteobacteria bacterium]
MNTFKFVLLGGAAMLAPLTSLASPTVYIPLGSANEILIVDAATDKTIGKISGFKNIHGLSLTPNGEYLVAGSNDEVVAGRPKMGGHGMMSSGKTAGHAMMSSKTGKPKSAASTMAKPAGVSEADHKKHHPQPGADKKTQDHSAMGGKPKATTEPPVKKDHANMSKSGQSKMKKPKGMSDADHKKHHAAQKGGLLPAVGISTVSLIRVADNKLETTIKVRGMAHHTFVTPDGKYAVSAHTTAGTISLIDLATKKIFRNIYTGPQPNYVVFADGGAQMYVSNAGNNTLSVIDTKNWIVSRNILVGKGPEHILMSPDEKFVYTNNGRGGTISKVSLEKLKVVKTFTIGNKPHGIDISADGKTLFASAKKDNKLVALDVKTGKVRTLKLDPAPYHVKVIGNTGKIYVSSRKKPFVWVVDAKQLKVIGKITVRGEGHQMVVVN